MKRLTLIFIATMTITLSFGQMEVRNVEKNELFLKAGGGTAWIIMPKVYIVSPVDSISNAQVLPATNGPSGFLGLQYVVHLGDGWLFVPEVDLTYVGGEVRVNRIIYNYNNSGMDTISSVQNVQSYVRAEIPLHFGVRSNDNFWVSFGPTLYFTLHDNKGFDNAVESLPPTINNPYEVKSDNPIGVRFRLAAYAPVGERTYIDVKFESDLGHYFRYENNTYEAKFSFQNISIGVGYLLNKDH